MKIPEQILHLIPFKFTAQLIVVAAVVVVVVVVRGVIAVVETIVLGVTVVVVVVVIVVGKLFVLNCERRRARCFLHHHCDVYRTGSLKLS